MSLTTGSHLGPYEIVAPLGAGGMGEVYRARDPRMGREVAIKLCAASFSDRFEREVRAVAALNHPNICQVYDVGADYLVLELVEGPTLADRILSGPIRLEEALTIARQIGDALEAAHEKGIIHRDLKPANIKIKPDGTVKVLDFGLAKMAEACPPGSGPEDSPTIAMDGTIAGQIMGTAAYMAPEQARGKPIDKRADIWAFGVVLYEMLTGRKLFEGETVSDTLAGVLTKDPDWQRAPVKTQRLLQSCLEKDPKRRLRDIGDAWRQLQDAPIAAAASVMRWKIAAAALAIISGITLAALFVRPRETLPQPAALRLDLDLGPNVRLGSNPGPAVILSPDGTRLVFVSEDAVGVRRLFTRRLDQSQNAPLAGTEGAFAPFFSPDGQWVGFFASGKLKKTRIDGGEPFTLCEAPQGRGGSWTEDGNIIAALDTQAGLSQVPSEGGLPAALTELAPGEDSHRWPQVLSGGKGVLFNVSIAYGSFDRGRIGVLSFPDRRRKTVLEQAGMFPRYVSSGHLLYATKGTLFAVPFAVERLDVSGAPKPLQEIWSDFNFGFAQLDFSRSGMLVCRTGRSALLRTVEWLDSSGKTLPILPEPALTQFPRWSPDGNRLAFTLTQGSTTDLQVYDLQRASLSRLTIGMATSNPVWSPDGQFIVFHSAGGIFWIRADGAGEPKRLTQSKVLQFPASFTPDGTRLAISEAVATGKSEIRTVPVAYEPGKIRAGEPELFLKTSTLNNFAAFSPDGRWLAYADAEGGSYEVFVRAFPDSGAKVQISSKGGTLPAWSRTGRELFYRTEDNHIMAVNYTIRGGAFVPEKPRVWSTKHLTNVGLGINLDLAPDGKRFAVMVPAETQGARESQNHVTLVVNFLDEVRRVAGRSK